MNIELGEVLKAIEGCEQKGIPKEHIVIIGRAVTDMWMERIERYSKEMAEWYEKNTVPLERE